MPGVQVAPVVTTAEVLVTMLVMVVVEDAVIVATDSPAALAPGRGIVVARPVGTRAERRMSPPVTDTPMVTGIEGMSDGCRDGGTEGGPSAEDQDSTHKNERQQGHHMAGQGLQQTLDGDLLYLTMASARITFKTRGRLHLARLSRLSRLTVDLRWTEASADCRLGNT